MVLEANCTADMVSTEGLCLQEAGKQEGPSSFFLYQPSGENSAKGSPKEIPQLLQKEPLNHLRNSDQVLQCTALPNSSYQGPSFICKGPCQLTQCKVALTRAFIQNLKRTELQGYWRELTCVQRQHLICVAPYCTDLSTLICM